MLLSSRMSSAHSNSARLASLSPSSLPGRARASSGTSLLERIGNTPLIELAGLTRELSPVQLLGKAEWYNPGGSVKDRAAANIVIEARRLGKLGPGKILLDSTSG